jgi:hypothetical protein
MYMGWIYWSRSEIKMIEFSLLMKGTTNFSPLMNFPHFFLSSFLHRVSLMNFYSSHFKIIIQFERGSESGELYNFTYLSHFLYFFRGLGVVLGVSVSMKCKIKVAISYNQE